jgi:hypothetical protein
MRQPSCSRTKTLVDQNAALDDLIADDIAVAP